MRWGHGHTFLGGMVAGGAFLSRNEWILLGLPSTFLLGLALGRFWLQLSRASLLAAELSRAKIDQLRHHYLRSV